MIDVFITRYIFDNYVFGLKRETESFELALQEGLKQDDFVLVQQLLTDLGSLKSVSAIRLVNLDGVVRASSNAGEVGIRLDTTAQGCIECHGQSGESIPFHQFVPRRDGSEGTNLLIANLLDNRVVCQGCHTDGSVSRGVILVEYRAEEIIGWRRNFSAGVYTGGAFLLISLFGILGMILHVNVFRPMQHLKSGKPDDKLLSRRDEFGPVAQRLRSLEQKVDDQEQQANIRRRNFQALMSITASLGDSISVERIFRTALGTVQEVTGYSTVAMRHYDPANNCFRLVVQNGMTPQMVEELHCLTADFPLHAAILSTQKAIVLTEDPSPSIRIHEASRAGGFRTVLCVPFLSGDRILGSMELGAKTVEPVSDEHIRWLDVVGRVIGSLLHQCELLERLRGTAVLQERSHVAQEIHDGLVQLLGSLRLWAEEAQYALDDGNLRDVQAAVRKIENTSRDAYSNLREEMLGLRETFQPGEGFFPVLREYLQRYQRQWGIETRLVVPCQDEARLDQSTPPAVEIQLLRMVQEGLTNVRRHARASLVEVQIDCCDQILEVEIIDNGAGFNPNSISEEKLGLRIMRERAAQVGGEVGIDTAPGQGTRLKIRIPM